MVGRPNEAVSQTRCEARTGWIVSLAVAGLTVVAYRLRP